MTRDAEGSPIAFRLPPEAYVSDAWLAREQELVFEPTWSLVASTDDVPEVGDALDVRHGRYELVLTRTGTGLHAFHNQCRHRGMALVCGPTHAGATLRCPYHGWEFACEDGAAVRIPQRTTQFEGLDPATVGLLPASVAVWEGMVFVHPSAAPPPFEDFLGAFPRGIGSFRPGLLTQVAHVELTGAFNWKLFVENHVDVYHLWYLHDRTLADFDHTRFEHQNLGNGWVSYEPMRAATLARAEAGATTAIDHLDARDRNGIGAHLLFPNMTMASTAEYFITYAVFPIGPTTSRVDLRVRADDPRRADELVAAARSFIDEDIVACEGVQRAIASPAFEVGPLARAHEQPIVAFHDQLLARLATPVARPARRAEATAWAGS